MYRVDIQSKQLIRIEKTVLKKEKIYKLDTAQMTAEEVKTEVWRYTFAYYNTVRVTTVTEGGYPPSVYKGKVTAIKSVA